MEEMGGEGKRVRKESEAKRRELGKTTVGVKDNMSRC